MWVICILRICERCRSECGREKEPPNTGFQAIGKEVSSCFTLGSAFGHVRTKCTPLHSHETPEDIPNQTRHVYHGLGSFQRGCYIWFRTHSKGDHLTVAIASYLCAQESTSTTSNNHRHQQLRANVICMIGTHRERWPRRRLPLALEALKERAGGRQLLALRIFQAGVDHLCDKPRVTAK